MDNDFYIQFANRFRGTQELIKKRLQIYIEIIKPLYEVYHEFPSLDLGCGRGEWLELLKENGWQGIGVDSNGQMVDCCRQSGHTVYEDDVVSFLKSYAPESVVIVTGFHIAEHLEFDILLDLIKEAYRILLPGGVLILETPNPENILVGINNFYIDPSHKNPLPAQLLSFLAGYQGFQDIKVMHLQESSELSTSKTTTLYNVLTGVSPDYSILAQKKGETDTPDLFSEYLDDFCGLSLNTLSQRYDSQQKKLNKKILKDLSLLNSNLSKVQADLQKFELDNEQPRTGSGSGRSILQLINELTTLRYERDGLKSRLDEISLMEEGQKVHFEQLKTDLKSLQAEYGNAISEKEVIQSDLVFAQTANAATLTELQELKIEREALKNQLYFTQEENQKTQAEIQRIYNTLTFRISKPIRTAYGKLRTRRSKRAAHEEVKQAQNYSNDLPEGHSFSPIPGNEEPSQLNPLVRSSCSDTSKEEYKAKLPKGVPEIDLDVIMEKIREEVKINKNPSFLNNVLEKKETKIYRLITRVHRNLQNHPSYKPLYQALKKLQTFIPRYQISKLKVSDILNKEDEEFVALAYKIILKRDADAKEFNYYLSMLRRGEISKMQILSKLRYSSEGKGLGVKIKGLPREGK